jgi:hypothetical protein
LSRVRDVNDSHGDFTGLPLMKRRSRQQILAYL